MNIKELLQAYPSFAQIIAIPFSDEQYIKLDFSASNRDLLKIDIKNTEKFNECVFNQLDASGAKVGYGGYNEDRIIYNRSTHFQGEEPRSIHLGIDLWVKARTEIFAPLDAVVHSYADNEGMGNYGPTIILEHEINDQRFFTLYGHLSKTSLNGLETGKQFRKGEKLGEIGDFPENGDWPPHLHFQIITDMMGLKGDFPGVAKPSERKCYLSICPDPNLILRLG